MNTHVQRTLSAFAIAGTLGMGAWAGMAIGQAVPTIDLTEIPDIDTLPVCAEEDCSDQPGQTGLWQSTEGDWYLERGETKTWLIIDNTVAFDAGYEI